MAPSQTVSVVPDGVLAYGMQLPVQALSVRVSMPWEQEATVDDMVRVAQAPTTPASSTSRCATTSRSRASPRR